MLSRAAEKGDIVLFVEAFASLAAAHLARAVLPFRAVARLASRPARGAEPTTAEMARLAGQMGWAVEAAARRAPYQAVCLHRALAAQAMLRRRGVPAVLHFGAASDAEGGLRAHAWVTAGGLPVIGADEAQGFAELARFPEAVAAAGPPNDAERAAPAHGGGGRP